jgi:hypothetical protein
MERLYRFTLPTAKVDGAKVVPPVLPRRLGPDCFWDLEERDFAQMTEFRQWVAAEGLEPGEEGLVREDGRLKPDDTLVLLSGTNVTTGPFDDRLSVREACDTCGLAVRRVRHGGTFAVEGDPPAGVALSYVLGADAFIAPTEVITELETDGFAAGLATAPVETDAGDYAVLYSENCVGDPVAPYGTDGETCPRCSRSVRRARDGVAYPASPRYSFFLLFDRPHGHGQWFWSTVDGQLRPMVTPDVARWLQKRDPAVNVTTRGWSPEDLERAFLPEEYR